MRVTIRLVSEMVVSIPSTPTKVHDEGPALVAGVVDVAEDVGELDGGASDVGEETVPRPAVLRTEVAAVASVAASVGVGAGGAVLQEVESSAVTSAHPTIRINC